MAADGFTKPLASKAFKDFLLMIGMKDISGPKIAV